MVFEAGLPRVLPHSDPGAAPILAPGHLDALWFQVTGTICNLRCAHCFLSCAPENDAFGHLSIDEIRTRLEESVSLGVREYYFTGGEPFLHPRIVDILSLALSYGPTTVLTNGTLLRPRHVEPLAAVAAASRWSLEFRLSLDGFDADSNDSLRGAGSFGRAMDGLELLLAAWIPPHRDCRADLGTGRRARDLPAVRCGARPRGAAPGRASRRCPRSGSAARRRGRGDTGSTSG